MALISAGRLDERRGLAAPGAPLGGLYHSLAADFEPVVERGVEVPTEKALLSRAGGRCPDDGTMLEFDPFSPHAHRCPRCARQFEGALHHRAWITWYQLWIAERALQAVLFHRLRGEERYLHVASEILATYANRYLSYPNADNVLGPSRLFFSTYLESIWLLQICVATEILPGSASALAGQLRDRVIEPARALIAEFDEGRSNRQVWNNAALLAAASACGDDAAFDAVIHRRSGVLAILGDALLEDGSWYEGENYHQFALRGLWYAVAIAEGRGVAIPRSLLARYHRAFAIPFATALPDFTMPSRKDSQYAVSLRQWRLAELTELGYARTGDPVLRQALARCYEPGHERRATGRAASAADAERNVASGALSRDDLGWRALLFAVPGLPPAQDGASRSVNLGAQGYAVFRREPDVYVGFDYGQSGGGHGHPDRLNLTLYQGTTRWLDDLGTGSYVDPSLHWYRSTLAHNAPLVNGRSQELLDGVLTADDEREGMGWAVANLDVPADETRLERAVMVATDYLVDELSWTSESASARVDLPLHLEGSADIALSPAELRGGQGLEDGFEFVRGGRAAEIPAGKLVRIDAARDGRALAAHIVCSADATLFEVSAPGQPARVSRRFFVMRAQAPEGWIRSVIAWAPSVVVSHVTDGIQVDCGPTERHLHRRDATGWHVELRAGSSRSSIDLAGFVARPPVPPMSSREVASHDLPKGGTLRFDLGREHYRRSEPDWEQAGAPAASVTVSREGSGLLLVARVCAGDLVFAPANAVNDFDNEHPDTMGAGLQLYLQMGGKDGAWSLVPDAHGETVRVRAIDPERGFTTPMARWQATPDGYEVRIHAPLPPDARDGESFHLDLYVNETVRGRVRRRGQLVLTGAAGEWVYLRGDRHSENRWMTVRLA
jgi:hypothetical protein